MIAEDYVLIQENIRKAIQSECEIVGVEDGKAALDAATTQFPDILLLDVSLPVLSGFAVAEKLNSMKSAVKVIFVTAHGDRDYLERAFEVGARGYVLKGKKWTDIPAAGKAVADGELYRSPLPV